MENAVGFLLLGVEDKEADKMSKPEEATIFKTRQTICARGAILWNLADGEDTFIHFSISLGL